MTSKYAIGSFVWAMKDNLPKQHLVLASGAAGYFLLEYEDKKVYPDADWIKKLVWFEVEVKLFSSKKLLLAAL